MSKESKEIYQFGPFRLDVGEHLFQRTDGEKSGSLPEKAFQTLVVLVRNRGRLVTKSDLLDAVWPNSFVEENNLDKAIHAVRHVLGERSGRHEYIETVRKHGYRFVAEVTKVDHGSSLDEHSASRSETNVLANFPAVLPKSRRTDSGTHVIVDLADWRELEGHTEAKPEHLHASESHADEEHITVKPTNAFQACQLAQFHFDQMTPPDMMKSRALLEEALRLDPDFAPAHAALAKQWVQEVVVGFQEPAVAYPQAQASLRRAFELDPTSAEYFTAAGFVGLLSEWDFAGAERHLRRALEINPHLAFANSWLGIVFMLQSEPDRAEPFLQLGVKGDPTSLVNQHLVAISRFLARRYEDAIEECEKMLAVYPRFMIAAWMRCWSLEQTGRAAEAVIEYEKALREPFGSVVHRWIGYALAVAGDEDRAREIASKLEAERRGHYLSPTHDAAIYAALNDSDRALDYLEMAVANRDPWMLWIATDPRFDNLTGNSRFDEIVKCVLEKGTLAPGENVIRSFKEQKNLSAPLPKTQVTTSGQHALIDLSDWHEVVERLDIKTDSPQPTSGQAKYVKSKTTRSRPTVLRSVSIAGVLAVLSIAAFVGAKLLLNTSADTAASFTEKRLTVEGGVTRIGISQDGRYAAAAQNAALVLFDLQSGSERILVPASKDTRIMAIAFHPAGSEIYYETRPIESSLVTLNKMPLNGGEPTKILDDIYGSLTFSPDGKKIAFLRRYPELNEYAMLIAEADGSNISRLASSQLPNRFDGTPVWSADGSKIACPAISTEGGFHFTVTRVDTATGAVERVPAQRWTGLGSLFWLANSAEVVVSGQAEGSINAQVWRLDMNTGASARITNDSFHYESISGTSDGRSIVAVKVRQSSHVWVLGDQQVQLTAGFDNKDGASGLAWSSDGKIFYHSRASGRDAIWRMQPDGSEAVEIVADTGGGFDVSPDGRLLVFQGKQSADHLGLQVRDLVDGSERALTQDITALSPSFFPDGKRVAFSIYDKKLALHEIAIDGGQSKMLTDEFRAAMAPSVSPSGRFIAFAFNRAQSGNIQAGIAVFDNESKRVTASHPVKITTGSQYEEPTVQWSADESEVYFIQLDNSVSNIMKLRLADGSVTNLTNFADGRIFNFAVEPNNGRLLVARGMVERDAMLLRLAE